MKNLSKLLLVAVMVVSGILLFQAQDFNGYRFQDDNNPLIDKPTREAFLHFNAWQDDGQMDVVTDVDGFDNYDAGVSFAEQWLTTDPNNPLRLFFGVNGPGNPPQYAYNSTNGGLNWSLVQPFYPGGTCCDPMAAYDNLGNLYYGSGVTGQYIYKSTNNGNTWSAGVLSVSGNDRNTLAIDQTNGPYGGNLYVAITNGSSGPFARSTDQGATWTQTYSNTNQVPGVMIAVGPNGSTDGGCVIYVTNTGASQNVTYTFQRSTDGGQTFQVLSNISDAGYVGTLNSMGRLVINNARTRPYPMIAMDNSNGPYRGRLYCVYASNVPAGNGNKPDIILRYSTDQGATWSSRITVNDNSNPELSDQWFPAIWCEKNTGKLYIKWYDTRENPGNYTTGVWATYSTTGGTSFAPNQRISNASWTYPCPACGANQNCYRGDYDGMTANSDVSFSIWYDPRSCNYQNMGAYFPDYAMKVFPAADSLNSVIDSSYISVSVPGVKLYTNSVKFSATVNPPPGAGNISLSFVDNNSDNPLDSLTSYPDSLRLKIVTSGNVTTGTYTVRIVSNGPNGTPVHVRNVNVLVNPTISIGNIGTEVPSDFYLYQNFPNPFNPTTNIRFDIAKSGLVMLKVYDVSGKEVAVLIDKEMTAGKYIFDYNASNLSSGVYFYRLEGPGFTSIKKMVLIK